MNSVTGEVNFDVAAKDFRVTLSPPPRVGDQIRVCCVLDSIRFKSGDTGFVAGEARPKCEYKGRFNARSASLLEHKFFTVTVTNGFGTEIGESRVDLWTVATGPVLHNLPLINGEGTEVGRVHYSLEFAEVSDVLVTFKELKFRNLYKPGPKKGRPAPNAYVKYSYSGYWPAVQANRMRANYSAVVKRNRTPEWKNLPPIRFSGSLHDMLRKSITLHVKHRSKYGSVSMLGRVNLLFRTLAERGSAVKQDDYVGFSGSLAGGAEIEGLMQFKRLPKLAQMVNASPYRDAVHTEKGILDGVPLMHYLPVPRGYSRPSAHPGSPFSNGPKAAPQRAPTPEPEEVEEMTEPTPVPELAGTPRYPQAGDPSESDSDLMEPTPEDEETNPFRRMMREGSESAMQVSPPAAPTTEPQMPANAPGIRGLMPASPFVYTTEPSYNPFVPPPIASSVSMSSLPTGGSQMWDPQLEGSVSAPHSPSSFMPGSPSEFFDREAPSIGLQPAAVLPMEFFEVQPKLKTPSSSFVVTNPFVMAP